MEYRIMSDKEVSKNTLSDNSNTETKKAALQAPDNNIKVKPAAKKPETSASAKKSALPKTPVAAKATGRKTAYVALIIASVSIFTSIGHYVWQQQQTQAQLLTLSQQNQQGQTQLKSNLTAEFKRQLQLQSQQLNKAASQSQQSAKQAHIDSDTQVQLLTAQISNLEQQVSQRDPNDWLIHEAEYLVRIAARTMWLERDTKAAISLLRDADNRLKELNHSKFLPIRALINEDIENLALMPTLTNQEAILTLMALNKQVASLTLAGVNLAEVLDEPLEDFALSEDINDWQSNLAKTWKKFLKDFISVRRRTGMVEPLMTPKQQQNLKQNLSLKIQLVQWAASEQKDAIYQQTLLDIQQWLNEFFDMDSPVNKKFYNAIEQLKSQNIYYDYPSDLLSLTAIKRLLEETKQGTPPKRLKPKKQKTEPTLQSDNTLPSIVDDTATSNSKKVSGGQL